MLQDYIWKAYTAPEAYSKHAPGEVCISNMVLEYVWLGKFFQIINGPYGPGPYWSQVKLTGIPKKSWYSLYRTNMPIEHV